MIDKLRKIDRTVLELETGILLSAVLCQLVGLMIPMSQRRYAVGLWSGILLAGIAAIHIWRSLNKAFLCDEKSAAKIVAGGYVVRYLTAGVFLFVLYYTDAGYVIAGFIGVMGLKLGAYLQPLTHKFYNRIFHETDPIPQPLCEVEGEVLEETEK